MMTKKILTAALLSTGLATATNAAIIGELGVLTDASGLEAGDQYRLIFVTSAGTFASSSDIATYDSFVQNAAANSTVWANLGDATWKVVGSTATVDADVHTGTDGAGGVPVFIMDGTTMFAANNADIWNRSNSDGNGGQITPTITENNTTYSGRVWTGTHFDGYASNPLGNAGGNTTYGDVPTTDNRYWTRIGSIPGANAQYSIYGMSEVLTAVPEPSSLALLGLSGLLIARRRRA